MAGKRLLLSVGPMRTVLDSVRYIQNRSSGKFGLEIARAAQQRGHTVEILLGPVEASIAALFSASFRCTRYEGPEEYGRHLARLFPECTVFLSLAAVLDFEVLPYPGKIERAALAQMENLSLPIRPVPDFVAQVARERRPEQGVIAFAAESGSNVEIQTRAQAKLLRKGADAIVANPVRPGFGPEADDNELWISWASGKTAHLGPASKRQLAGPLLDVLLE